MWPAATDGATRANAGTAPICAEGAVALGGVPNVSDYERLLGAIGESEA